MNEIFKGYASKIYSTSRCGAWRNGGFPTEFKPPDLWYSRL
ncbi:MAG: hypothetical protein ABIK73_09415 [candidate division WOR-3 bacterium]